MLAHSSTSLFLALSFLSLTSPLSTLAAKSKPKEEVILTAEATVPLRTHSLYAPYVDSDLQNRWWDFGADAIINTNKHIRLTQDRPSEMGWLWSRLPLTAGSYQIDVEFKIDGKSPSIHGDGMAMWLTKSRAIPGPVFGNQDYFNGLAIFFDTYPNSRHSYQFPRVSAMMGDGQKSYDHATDGANHEIAACSADIRKTEVASKARLTYIKDQYLQLELHYKAWDEWTSCFKINTTMPVAPYLGFSALTGQVSDAHDIISVSTSSAVLSTGSGNSNSPSGGGSGSGGKGRRANGSKHGNSNSGGGGMGWFLFMIKVIAFFAVLGFAYSGWKTYKAKTKKRNRRSW
ncbi:legume-like lectin family-domain-containing protein [Mrakia frigida]|uniref:Uip5p n=1 Tax=Mrakia frigida TaxID=29902 RepID=UPI003FCC2507